MQPSLRKIFKAQTREQGRGGSRLLGFLLEGDRGDHERS